jgi:hypothetical protein
MKYAIVILVVLVAVVALVVAVGFALPVKHRATRQASFRATPEQLFALITNVEAFPSWRSSVQRVEQLPSEGGKQRFREVAANGNITYVVDEQVPNRRVVTRIADRSLPFGGSWTYELLQGTSAESTVLRITEDGEVYNPIFRFVSRFVLGHHATLDRYLKDLDRRIAVGADVSTSL